MWNADIRLLTGIVTMSVQFVLAMMVLFLHPQNCVRCKWQTTARVLLVTSLLISFGGNLVNTLYALPRLIHDVFFFWSCSTQNVLMGFVSVFFAHPVRTDRRFIIRNCLVYGFFNLLLILSALFFPAYFTHTFIVSFAAGVLLSIYVFREAMKIYGNTIRKMEEYYSDDYNYMKKMKTAFDTAIVVGLILLMSVPFMNFFPLIWRTAFLCFYIYVAVIFIRQGYNMELVYRVFDNDAAPTGNVPEEETGTDAVRRFEIELKKWIGRKGYLQSDVSTESIANSLGTDIYTFREYFRTEIGEDFRTWRQRLRIEEACRIMESDPDLSYEIVAEMSGINDRSNFKKTFTKIKGVSPKEWTRSRQH